MLLVHYFIKETAELYRKKFIILIWLKLTFVLTLMLRSKQVWLETFANVGAIHILNSHLRDLIIFCKTVVVFHLNIFIVTVACPLRL